MSQEEYEAVVEKINTELKTEEENKNKALGSLRDIKATIETAKIDVQDAFVEKIYEFFVAYPELKAILNNASNKSKYKLRAVQIKNNQELITSRDYGDYLGEIIQKIRNKLNQSNNTTKGSRGLGSSSFAQRSVLTRRVIRGGESDSLLDSRVESLGFEYKDLLDSLQILNYLYVASLSACELILKRMKEGTFRSPDYGKAVQRIERVSIGVNERCNRVIKGYLASIPPKTLLEQIASNLNKFNALLVDSFFKDEEDERKKKFQDNLLKSIQGKEKTKVFLSGDTETWINALKEALNKLKLEEGQSPDVVKKIDAVLQKLDIIETNFVAIPSSSGGRRKKVKSTKKNKKSNSKKQRKSRKGRRSMRRRART